MKKILSFILLMVLIFNGILLNQNAIAGDETNPEISDSIRDVILFEMGKMFFVNQIFKNIDIISVWFHENSDNPNILNICLKIRQLRLTSFLKSQYAISWEYSGRVYFISLHSYNDIQDYYIGYIDNEGNEITENYNDIGYIDIDENIIHLTIPKEYIGNPEPGDELNSFYCNCFIRTLDDHGFFNRSPNIASDRAYSIIGTSYEIIY